MARNLRRDGGTCGTRTRLLTNHSRKVVGLDAFGIEITGSAALE